MNIHWLQHVPFEGLGSIGFWAEKKGHTLIATRLWAGDELPDPEDVHMLIIMGGPMGVSDDQAFSWLAAEKQLLCRLVDSGCALLGICLGAQLLADALGAKVYRNREKEIGWFPVVSADGIPSPFAGVFPDTLDVFHWHGDTFDIPAGGMRIASSRGCCNQGFIVGDRILGLQYHLEMTPSGLSAIIAHCRDELVDGEWVQCEEDIVQGSGCLTRNNLVMDQVLDTFEKLVQKNRPDMDTTA